MAAFLAAAQVISFSSNSDCYTSQVCLHRTPPRTLPTCTCIFHDKVLRGRWLSSFCYESSFLFWHQNTGLVIRTYAATWSKCYWESWRDINTHYSQIPSQVDKMSLNGKYDVRNVLSALCNCCAEFAQCTKPENKSKCFSENKVLNYLTFYFLNMHRDAYFWIQYD